VSSVSNVQLVGFGVGCLLNLAYAASMVERSRYRWALMHTFSAGFCGGALAWELFG
jgi:hypothetical protein